MVRIRTLLRRHKRGVASATIMSLVLGTVVALSLNYEGVATADVDLNDGGVWVSNNSSIMVGRLNYPIGEIDATLAAQSQDVDLLQRQDVVFVRDRAANGIQRLDPASVAVQGMVPLPGQSDVQLGQDTLGVLVGETGEWRVLGLNDLDVLKESSEDPQAVLGEGAAQAIADDGTAYGLNTQDGQLLTFPPGQRTEPEVTELDPGLLTDDTQLTAVGHEVVALSYDEEDDSLALLRPEEEPVDLSDLDIDRASARLQPSSADGDVVALATSDALVQVPLDGGEARVEQPSSPGEPAQPVQVAGCVHSAWTSESSEYLRVCGDSEAVPLPVPEGASGELKFRTNRNYVVLNELSTGNSWMIEDALILVDNWDDLTPPTEEEEEEEEDSEDLEERELELDREAENRDPVAEPDSFGVRAGRTVLLPVLDNDSDADGDLLTVGAFEDVPESFGSVEPILGGRALQIQVAPGASGTTSFQYTADDGRGGTDDATVDLTVRGAAENSPPEQQRDIEATITSGASTEVNLLDDMQDPDGDPMYVVDTVDAGGLNVVANPNGMINITDPGVQPGMHQVRIEVSDGQDSAEAVIDVEVLPQSAQPPTAVFDFETAFVGQAITIDPIANDVDPNGEPLRLANISGAEGASISQNSDSTTFQFQAESAGDYYVTYVVADDDGLSATGLVRVNVRAAEDDKPIAVADTALLPPAGTVLVDVLENDFDPAGGVLAVQQIDVPQGQGLQVAILDHRILRISSERALPGPVTITYTVSNGTSSAEGEVLVLPMDDEAQTQGPVAVADTVRVRAGDHVTIPVLANDSHPNGLPFTLDDELVEEPEEGLIFTAGDMVRFQAPDEASTVHAVYSITDDNGRTDSARITINVQARADDANTPPEPRDEQTRAFAGERIRIPIQTYGIDPDGDSVQLLGTESAPSLGRIVEVGPSYIDYQAYTDSAGADEFTYAVRDRLGAMATASVTVGVIPPPATNRDPVTVNDQLSVRPGRDVTVDVLENDTDPDGDQLALDDPPFGETDGIEAGVQDGNVAFTAPEEAGTYLVEYNVTDLHGGTAQGLLTVDVDPDATPQAPVAVDDVVPPNEIVDRTEVRVEVLANDYDPDGSREALEVSVPGDQDGVRAVDNQVEVQLTDNRQVVTYKITDEDGLSSYAFIDVPGLTDTGPVLRPDLEPIQVEAGVSETIELNDYVISLSGDPVQLADTTSVRASNSDGSSPVVDTDTLQFTSDPDYVGPATVTFEVTDAEDINSDDILTSVLTLDIEVYSEENKPPRMRNGSLSAEVGGDAVTLDLARLAEDPDGQSTDLEYAIAEQAPGFTASLDGYILTVQADNDTATGSVEDLPITVTDGESDPVSAVVELTATSSNRPLISTNPDDAGELHQGRSTTVDVLENDSNPFPGEPREITDVQVDAEQGTASIDGDSVTLTPASDYVGRMNVVYTVVDVTGDPEREVQGQVTAAVLGAPEAPTIPLVEQVGNGQVALSWTAPEDNGSPITGYTVNYNGGSQQCPSTTCTISGLSNGTTYTFTAVAQNEVGDSEESPASAEATPDVRPEAPGAPTVEFGDGELTLDWNTPENEGTPITSYDVQINPASGRSQQSVNGTQMTWTGLTNGQNYTFRVRAINDAPDPGQWSEWSAAEHPSGPPAQPAAPQTTRIDDADGGRLMVEWRAPDNNGDPISSYELRMYQDGDRVQTFTPGGGQTSREVQVENAHDYQFSLVAINRSGDSEMSARSEEVRSFGKPGRVGNVSAEPTGVDNTAEVSHNEPSNNGQAISRYEYRLNGGSVQNLPSGGKITVPNDGTSYRVQVRACNTYCGAWSAQSSAFSTYGPPGTSTVDITSSADGQRVNFSWDIGSSDNGAALNASRYRIDGGSWQNVSGRSGSANVSGDWEENHTIDVQVRNEHGQWSDSSASKSQRAGEDPTPPARMWITHGDPRGCQSSGSDSGCVRFKLNWENIPAADQGTYDVWISVSNGCFDRRGPYSTSVDSTDGSIQLGNPGYTPPHLDPNCSGTVDLEISPNGGWADDTAW